MRPFQVGITTVMRAFTVATLSADDSHDGPHLARSKPGSSIAVSATPLLPRLARNFSAQFVARLASTLVQAGALVLVARTLGPSRYGLFAVIVTLTVMVSVVAEWGLPLIAARTIAGGAPRPRRGAGGRSRTPALAGRRRVRRRRRPGVPRSDSGEVRLGALIASSELPAASLARLRADPGATRTAARAQSHGRRWARHSSGAAWMLAVVGLGGGIPVLAIGLLVSADRVGDRRRRADPRRHPAAATRAAGAVARAAAGRHAAGGLIPLRRRLSLRRARRCSRGSPRRNRSASTTRPSASCSSGCCCRAR